MADRSYSPRVNRRTWETLSELPDKYTMDEFARLVGHKKASVREALRWLDEHKYIRITEETE